MLVDLRAAAVAGVPGLEPRLTEPESVGLPITPYPIGARRTGEKLYPAAHGKPNRYPRTQATLLDSVPIPSTVTVTVSPATSCDTPAGVPVSTMSPGSN